MTEPPDYVPSTWRQGRFNLWFERSPLRVLLFFVVMAAVAAGLIVAAVVDPRAYFNGPRAVGAIIGAAVVLPTAFRYAPRAWRAMTDRRA